MRSHLEEMMITRREALRRAGGGAAALGLLPAFLAACGSSASNGGTGVAGEGTDAEIDQLTWTLGGRPETLDIATAFNSPAIQVMAVTLEAPLTYGDDLSLAPGLAESWDKPDLLHYVYTVREGVQFWDGTPLTAEDMAFSIGRHADPDVASLLAGYFANFRSVEVTGEREVTVTLKQPDPLFQYVPTLTFVTPKAFSERIGKRLGTAGDGVNTMGAGPYRITRFSDSEVSLERNADYWGELPRVRTASLTFVDNPRTNLLAARSGEIDGLFQFPVPDAEEWERIDGVGTQSVPGMNVWFLSFNLDAEPWSDVHVRRAIAHAADRGGYVEAFQGGLSSPATSVVPMAQWGELVPSEDVEAIYAEISEYPFDLEQARAELAQSSWPDGFSAEISFPNSDPDVGRALVSLSETLKELGIDLTVNEVTLNQWLDELYAHEDLGLNVNAFSPDFPDPANYPLLLFPSANAVKNGYNRAHWRNPQVDRLLEQQNEMQDPAARAEVIGEVLRLAGEELPYLGLWWVDNTIAVNDDYVYNGFTALDYTRNWLGELRVRA